MAEPTEQEEEKKEKIFEQVEPTTILNDIREGAAAHAVATQEFVNSFEFYGKSLNTWSVELRVRVPPKPDQEDLRAAYISLANNIQTASHYHSVASTINSAISGGGQLKKADLIKAIVDTYVIRKAKAPGAQTLERMADSYMRNTINTRVAAKIVKDFWKQKLDALIETRKCLEQVSVSISVELKYLTGENSG